MRKALCAMVLLLSAPFFVFSSGKDWKVTDYEYDRFYGGNFDFVHSFAFSMDFVKTFRLDNRDGKLFEERKNFPAGFSGGMTFYERFNKWSFFQEYFFGWGKLNYNRSSFNYFTHTIRIGAVKDWLFILGKKENTTTLSLGGGVLCSLHDVKSPLNTEGKVLIFNSQDWGVNIKTKLSLHPELVAVSPFLEGGIDLYFLKTGGIENRMRTQPLNVRAYIVLGIGLNYAHMRIDVENHRLDDALYKDKGGNK